MIRTKDKTVYDEATSTQLDNSSSIQAKGYLFLGLLSYIRPTGSLHPSTGSLNKICVRLTTSDPASSLSSLVGFPSNSNSLSLFLEAGKLVRLSVAAIHPTNPFVDMAPRKAAVQAANNLAVARIGSAGAGDIPKSGVAGVGTKVPAFLNKLYS